MDSVEAFWSLVRQMKPAGDLAYGCDYYLFRENIQPLWEHECNKNGGTWVISSHQSKRHTHLGRMWLEIIMSLIGESFGDDSDEICGAAVTIRGQYDKCTIWTKNCENIEANRRIGQALKNLLGVTHNMEYLAHIDNQNKNGRMGPKPRLVV